MNKRLITLLILSTLATTLQAVPIQWSVGEGSNGHFYEAISVGQPIDWTQARDAAVSAGGYLCTITSPEENTFVFNLVKDLPEMWTFPNGDMGPWLGGYQDRSAPDYSEPAGGWRWVTGDDEPFVYTNWSAANPSNMLDAEDWLHFYGTQYQGQWNDTGYPGDYVVSYIVEVVPEPTTLLLLGLGGLMLRKRV
jgi:hypothetical protein